MSDKPKYTIAVTGLNAIDSPGPGIAVIKSLKEAQSFDVRIIGLSYENLEPGVFMRHYVDKSYQVPFPGAGMEVLFERLAYINHIEQIDFLFPNFDAELFNYIKLQDRLSQELQIEMVLPTLEQFEARHKVNLYEYGQKYDIKVPRSEMVFTEADLSATAKEMGFPAVIKGKFYDAYVAYTPDQALNYFHKISSKWGLPIIVQQYVYGTEVNVCGVGDGHGVTIGAVPMRKLYITDKGKAWAGVSIDDEELLEGTNKMVERTKWRGPFELEYMKTSEGDYYLLEINPRFPAWCYLTTGAGQNQVEDLVNIGMGKKVEPKKEFAAGKMFVRYSEDMIVDLEEFEKISTAGEL
jgi:carbamoyl-phosphate synthase large subunit